jgi:UDP-2,3-diacylglucosamine pyrophosphatase LpxH
MKRCARTVWISDVHLGTPLCQYLMLLAFLKSFRTDDGSKYNLETLYLNGDIIDVVQMHHGLFWSKHRLVIKELLRMADRGVKIIYIPGNHEQPFRNEYFRDQLIDLNLNGIIIKEQDIFTALNGDQYLVTHGDEFDGLVRMNPIFYKLGDLGYNILIKINQFQNFLRRCVGLKPWSFSLWLKSKVKDAVKFISNFEHLIVSEAKTRGVIGVINGHIHKLDDKMIDGIHYLNSGCWTEFCSYIIETVDGVIKAEYYETT